MAQFSYKARRRSGEVVQGVLDVADRTAALTQIERLGLFPVAVEAAKGAAGVQKGRAPRPGAAAAGVFSPAPPGPFYCPRPTPPPRRGPLSPQVGAPPLAGAGAAGGG